MHLLRWRMHSGRQPPLIFFFLLLLLFLCPPLSRFDPAPFIFQSDVLIEVGKHVVGVFVSDQVATINVML